MCTSANRRRSALAAATAVGLVLAGCAVGPDFKTPSAPHVDRYPDQAVPARLTADGSSQTIELGGTVDSKWWRLLGSADLEGLVEEGLRNSPTLASARAALEQSRDQARAGAGVFYPSVQASAGAARERISPVEFGEGAAGSTFNLYTLSGSVGYVLDLFGGERRNVEALRAEAAYQGYAAGAAYLLLTGNIVNAAIAHAGYAAETETLSQIVSLDRDQRDTLMAEYKAGYGALSPALAAEQQLAVDEQSLAQVRERLAASENLLKTLTGREAGEAGLPLPKLADLHVPADAPVSLPSQVVRQRPDILEAEATLHQATAQVGVATAALFPSISITGDYGAASTSLAKLASPYGRFWSVGPTVDVPIFEGGQRWYQRKQAQAAMRKAAADYRQTVLSALEQVSDSIKALDADADSAEAARGGYDAAQLSWSLVAVNRKAGVSADYDAAAAQLLADQARLTLIAAQSQRLQDVVALYVASGGGWIAQDSPGRLLASAPR